MTMTDPLGDMLTRIRNGHMAKKALVECPMSKLRAAVLAVLKKEGFIRGYSIKTNENNKANLIIELKYFEGKPAIKEIKRSSKPGLRLYSSKKDMPLNYGGLGISIVSTSKGLMSDHEARNANIGGEILCSVF
ncbi:MAG: 30S ribosomal protein S8 [Pelagibacterales bacterium]|jgi:small subunit ribosomal protein S8|nr:30S ribosomal protein S8 [Pelagibacterales bacterium]MDG2268176.1 30S ribosomal protein S8 [Alphaproteobacteria bacterium]